VVGEEVDGVDGASEVALQCLGEAGEVKVSGVLKWIDRDCDSRKLRIYRQLYGREDLVAGSGSLMG